MIERVIEHKPLHITQLRLINRLEDGWRATLHQLETLKAGKLTVAIDGARQDDAMHAEVLPVVERLLRLRLQSLVRDLQGLGFSVD
jgi:hypothetical protein